MDRLPPYLTALAELIRPFCDEQSLKQLHEEFAWLKDNTKVPNPTVPVPTSTKAPRDVARELRDALDDYVVRCKPGENWTRCPTPGCENGWRK